MATIVMFFTFSRLFMLFLLSSTSVTCYNISSERLHSINLDHGSTKLTWMIDWQKSDVYFYIKNAFTYGKFKSFAIGFSQRGELSRVDLCLFSYVNKHYQQTYDTYTSRDFKLLFLDTRQNCEVIQMNNNIIAFRRKFDTCDPQDIPFHSGTMYIVWWRTHKLVALSNSSSLIPKHRMKDHGVLPVQLLRADSVRISEQPHEVKQLDVRLDRVLVPSFETTYWCKIQLLDSWLLKAKHHIVQFEPVIDNEELVHHMEVFQCVTKEKVAISIYNGPCENMPASGRLCSKVMALWAMGAGSFTYPSQTGLPIGGQGFNPYIRLEVHFNNPQLKSKYRDSSGMRIKLVSKLRRYDAAVMELGLEYTDKMAIPPGQTAFPITGYCIPECTKLSLPQNGIVVFGSQLHTHLRGVRVITRHFRGKEEQPIINHDDFFSHHYQEIRQLRYRPRVLPGDALITTCYYDTRGYTTATLGGFSINDEMCVNYIHYFPATELELCKSSIADKSLYKYFGNIRDAHNQHLSEVNGPRSENYQQINWTYYRATELIDVYHTEPLSMQCNKSNGLRFDGFNWENAPIPILNHFQYSIKTTNFKTCPRFPYELNWFKPLIEGLCDNFNDCIYAENKLKE